MDKVLIVFIITFAILLVGSLVSREKEEISTPAEEVYYE